MLNEQHRAFILKKDCITMRIRFKKNSLIMYKGYKNIDCSILSEILFLAETTTRYVGPGLHTAVRCHHKYETTCTYIQRDL